MYYWETYNASEGFFGVQLSDNSKEMLLMLDSGIYYEFVPISEWDKENPKTLTLDEVETGQNYAIIISTNGGLWRYMIGDTIEFSSTTPYLFHITGRTKNFINAFGERTDNRQCRKSSGRSMQDYRRTNKRIYSRPVYFGDNNNGAHEWLIEFTVEPNNLEDFTYLLDSELKKVNSRLRS